MLGKPFFSSLLVPLMVISMFVQYLCVKWNSMGSKIVLMWGFAFSLVCRVLL